MAVEGDRELQELRGVHQFLQSQAGLLADGILEQQCQVWERKISGLNLNAQTAQGYVDAIRAGPWPDALMRRLLMAVNSSVLQATQSPTHRRPMQTCRDFTGYFSREDQRMLRDATCHTCFKIEVVARRCFKVGLHLPTEPTIRHVLAVAQHIGLKTPKNAGESYELVQLFKKDLKALCKNSPRPDEHIANFPGDPGNLPEAVFKAAYDLETGEGDPPVGLTVSMTDLAGLEGNIPLRSASRLMQHQQSQAASSSALANQTAFPGPQNMDPHTMAMCNMMMQMYQYATGQGQVPDPNNLAILNPRATRRPQRALQDDTSPDARQAALTDRTPQTSPAGSPPGTGSPAASPTATASTVPGGSPPAAAVPATTASPATASPAVAASPAAAPALTVPAIADQIDAFQAAVVARGDARAEEKENDDEKDEPKAKAKAKAKAKGKAKASPTSKAKAKAKAKAEAMETENAEEKVGEAEAPSKKKKRVLPKSERVVHPLGQRPPVMGPSDPTVYYGPGKVNRNSRHWRVFAKTTDRNDRAIKIGDEQVSWIKCLEHIEECAQKSK